MNLPWNGGRQIPRMGLSHAATARRLAQDGLAVAVPDLDEGAANAD